VARLRAWWFAVYPVERMASSTAVRDAGDTQ
jgi:hypothetical protein